MSTDFNKIPPVVSHKSPSQPYWAAFGSGGGGGGGSVVTTSSITVSTITAAGAITDFISGDPTKAAYNWAVGVDGPNNAFMVLSAPSTQTAYFDVRVSDGAPSPANPITILRTSANNGEAQIGLIPNPANPATTGLRFVSSLNGGSSATGLITSSDFFPLGIQSVPTSNATCPAQAFGVPVMSTFTTIAGHNYEISLGVSESVTGVPNADDRTSYTIGSAFLDTILDSEISTLQGTQPRGRTIHGVFNAVGTTQQVVVSKNNTSLTSTIVTAGINPGVAFVRDLGPGIVLP